MIKYLSITFILAALLVSCGSEPTVEEDTNDPLANNFAVSGVVSGAQNTAFYLEAQSQQGTINIAQATADADGKFSMEGNIPGLGMYQLRMGDSPQQVILLTLAPGDKFNLEATADTYVSAPKGTGTDWAPVMSKYMAHVAQFRIEQESLNAQAASLSQEELQKKFESLKADIDNFAMNQMKAEPGNPYNIILSTYAVPSADFQDFDPASLEVLRSVADAFGGKYPASPITAALSNQVYQIEMAYNQHLANNSGTRVAPEIALNNPQGQVMKLSDLRGKYVLIDFWASWCAPCRREMPNVVNMYNKYKNDGFTVFSVSLDNNAEKWKAAIKDDGMIWPNHVSDLLQWKSPMPSLYGFNGIPHTVLVNPEGNIIATGLRGDALEQKLKEIFKK